MMRMVLVAFLVLGLGATILVGQENRPSGSKAASVQAPINLNSATTTELESLPGIGPATAQRIVEYRQQHGSFKKIEELMNVRGIGEASFLKIKALVSLSPPKSDRAAIQVP